MSYLRLKKPTTAYDAYLYGGYLFLFMKDGTIKYVRFDDLLWAASEDQVDKKKHLQLAFLPHQYLKGSVYRFLHSFSSIREKIEKEQNDCIQSGDISLEDLNIDQLFTTFAEIDEIPFDVCIYGGELFLASDAGVHRSSLQADINYSIDPTPLDKIIDCPALSLNAKAGMLAVSAEDEGLFSHEIFSEGNRFIKDKPAYKEKSIKAEWSTLYTLINYPTLQQFSLLENDVEKKESQRISHLPRNYRKDARERNLITEIGKREVEMADLMRDTGINVEDLAYAFNTQTSGFFFFNDGGLQVRKMVEKNSSYHYSSKSVHESDLSSALADKKPMSAIAVPNGCMVETYDKVFLVRQNEVSLIADEPIYGIRSYLSSNNYRNLATVVYNDHVEVISFPQLPSPAKRDDSPFRPGFLKEAHTKNTLSSNDDFLF